MYNRAIRIIVAAILLLYTYDKMKRKLSEYCNFLQSYAGITGNTLKGIWKLIDHVVWPENISLTATSHLEGSVLSIRKDV